MFDKRRDRDCYKCTDLSGDCCREIPDVKALFGVELLTKISFDQAGQVAVCRLIMVFCMYSYITLLLFPNFIMYESSVSSYLFLGSLPGAGYPAGISVGWIQAT